MPDGKQPWWRYLFALGPDGRVPDRRRRRQLLEAGPEIPPLPPEAFREFTVEGQGYSREFPAISPEKLTETQRQQRLQAFAQAQAQAKAKAFMTGPEAKASIRHLQNIGALPTPPAAPSVLERAKQGFQLRPSLETLKAVGTLGRALVPEQLGGTMKPFTPEQLRQQAPWEQVLMASIGTPLSGVFPSLQQARAAFTPGAALPIRRAIGTALTKVPLPGAGEAALKVSGIPQVRGAAGGIQPKVGEILQHPTLGKVTVTDISDPALLSVRTASGGIAKAGRESFGAPAAVPEAAAPITVRAYRAETGVPGLRSSKSYALNEAMAVPETPVGAKAPPFKVVAQDVTLQNPLRIKGLQGDLLDQWAKTGDQEAARILAAADKAGAPPPGWYREADTYIAKKAGSLGYDGVFYDAGRRGEIAVFEPGLVKPAPAAVTPRTRPRVTRPAGPVTKPVPPAAGQVEGIRQPQIQPAEAITQQPAREIPKVTPPSEAVTPPIEPSAAQPPVQPPGGRKPTARLGAIEEAEELIRPMPRQQVAPPEQVVAREQARQEIAREFFDAVPGSPMDEAATAYWQTGDFQGFIDRLPPHPMQPGPGFAEATFAEVGRVSGRFADPTRLVEAIDLGVFGHPLQRYVLWPTRRMFLSSLRFGDSTKFGFREVLQRYNMLGFQARRMRQVAGDVLEFISREEALAPLSTLVEKPEIRRFLIGRSAPDTQRIVGFAQETRRFLDNLLDMQNAARLKRGHEPIRYLENYRPWVRETNLWARLGFADQPAKIISQAPLAPDFIKPNAPFNPRAAARMGGLRDYEKVRDLQTLGFDYIETARKDIFYSSIVQNAKVHIKELRNLGYENAAASIEDWILESYAGKLSSLSKGIREHVPPPLVTGAKFVRRQLTRAVFPLNWTWNIFVQTSSGAMTVGRYGITDTLRGFDYLIPSVRSLVQKNAYSSIVKNRQGGRVAFQDVAPSTGAATHLEGSLLQRAEDYANLLTSTVEDTLTGISVRAAYHQGKRQGLKGRALWEYASEGGAKTQSMYNLEDAPGVLRTKEIGTLAPFQTFAFEVMNTVRELNLPGLGRMGLYAQPMQKRLISLARWIAAMIGFNALGDRYINREPWEISSFVPFWGLVTGGLNAGNPWNYPLPLKYTADFKRGLDDYLRYGDWKRLRTWVIQYHTLGGTQINRTLKGVEAMVDGRVTDVRGRTLFTVEPSEWLKAITQGVYSTSGGREYIDELRSRGGFLGGRFEEITGIPLPEFRPQERGEAGGAPSLRLPSPIKKPVSPLLQPKLQIRQPAQGIPRKSRPSLR